MEPPPASALHATWEQSSLTVTQSSPLLSAAQEDLQDAEPRPRSALWEAVRRLWAQRPWPSEREAETRRVEGERKLQAAKSRQATAASALHSVDKALRAEVSTLMRNAGRWSKSKRGTVAAAAGRLRKQLLADAKARVKTGTASGPSASDAAPERPGGPSATDMLVQWAREAFVMGMASYLGPLPSKEQSESASVPRRHIALPWQLTPATTTPSAALPFSCVPSALVPSTSLANSPVHVGK